MLGAVVGASATDVAAQIDGFPRTAVESGWTSDRYTRILERYVPADGGNRICVNVLDQDAGCIPIFVLKHQASADLAVSDAHPEAKGLSLNAKALSAGYILIDDLLLDFIFVNALNQKTLMFADHGDPNAATGAESDLVLATLQQLANLRFSLKGDPELAAIGWKSVSELADLWLARDPDEASLEFTATFFALLLEHEIAHLGIGLSWFEKMLRKGSLVFDRRALIEEERRADRIGMDRIYKVVGEALGRSQPGYDQQFADLMQGQPFTVDDVRSMLASQHALSFANFLRDISISTAFDGFRESPAEQNVVTWIFRPCSERVKRDDVYIGDPRDLRGAVLRDLPVLTAEEFAKMRSRWVGIVSEETHDHNLIRVASMYEEIERRDIFGMYRTLGQAPYTLLLRALVENKPSLVWEHYGDPEHPMPNADKAAILSVLAPHGLEPAVTCPEGDCYVARIAGLGLVEVITRGPKVLRLRASLTLSPDHSEDDIKALLTLAPLLDAAGIGLHEMERALLEVRRPIRECYFGTTMLELEHARVFSTSLDHKGKLFLDVSALTNVE